MTLSEIAARYHVSVPTLKKWLSEFVPSVKTASGCYLFTPDQVKRIIEACGEFPS